MELKKKRLRYCILKNTLFIIIIFFLLFFSPWFGSPDCRDLLDWFPLIHFWFEEKKKTNNSEKQGWFTINFFKIIKKNMFVCSHKKKIYHFSNWQYFFFLLFSSFLLNVYLNDTIVLHRFCIKNINCCIKYLAFVYCTINYPGCFWGLCFHLFWWNFCRSVG